MSMIKKIRLMLEYNTYCMNNIIKPKSYAN